jgi:hypothetical protein
MLLRGRLRTCKLFVALLVFAGGSIRAEPILPTADGTTWEYGRQGIEPASLTVRIAGKENVGGKELIRVETLAGDELTMTELWSVTDRGVLRHRITRSDGDPIVFDPPQTLVPAPLRPGVKWELEDEVEGTRMRQQFTVVGETDVDLAAGKFRAFHLRCEQPWPISITIDRWFVPGTGFVKDITTTRGPNGRLLSRVSTVLNKMSVIPPSPSPTPTPTPSPSPSASPTPTPAASASPSPSPAPVTASSLINTPTAPAARDLMLVPTAAKMTLEVAKDRDGEPQDQFRSDVAEIFVRWNGEHLPVGSFVRVAWIAEDVGDLVPPNFIIDETETEVTTSTFGARFTLSRPKDGWAAGNYRLELYLDDTLIQTAKVSIRD